MLKESGHIVTPGDSGLISASSFGGEICPMSPFFHGGPGRPGGPGGPGTLLSLPGGPGGPGGPPGGPGGP